VEGGSANDYDYANGDPVNGLDLTGTCPPDDYVTLCTFVPAAPDTFARPIFVNDDYSRKWKFDTPGPDVWITVQDHTALGTLFIVRGRDFSSQAASTWGFGQVHTFHLHWNDVFRHDNGYHWEITIDAMPSPIAQFLERGEATPGYTVGFGISSYPFGHSVSTHQND
jgi:hypothetical protein